MYVWVAVGRYGPEWNILGIYSSPGPAWEKAAAEEGGFTAVDVHRYTVDHVPKAWWDFGSVREPRPDASRAACPPSRGRS